jgi:hypothetical protein
MPYKNREQANAYHREYRKTHPRKEEYSKLKNRKLKERYNITREQYDKMLKSQNGLCAICLKPEKASAKNGTVWELAVDHCHKTGQVRGLLCNKCNRAIGYLDDNRFLAERATKYLLLRNRVYWIIGMMCVGKTYYSNIFGEMLGLTPFHLDHIRHDIPLVEAYREAITTGFIEGFTPHRNQGHLEAITQALEGKEVFYILIEPTYEQWLENCKPVIACPTDENPPSYTKEEYEAENRRLRELQPRLVVV